MLCKSALLIFTTLIASCEWASRVAGVTPQQAAKPVGRQQDVKAVEDRLVDAGFTQISPKTSEDFKKIESLPPLQLTYRIGAGGKLVYYFADPYFCYCLFRGDEQAYQRYQKTRLSAEESKRESHSETIRKAEQKAVEAETMGPFGIDSPFGGAGPGTSMFAY